MGSEADARRQSQFNRSSRRNLSSAASRIAERQRREAGVSRGGTGPRQADRVFEMPARPGARATLVELDNPDEFLELHWDPSSYQIGKAARWAGNKVEGGTDTLNYSGCDVTKISMELLFDQVDIRHNIQRSVEDSIGWLFNRLRPRNAGLLGRRGKTSREGQQWLGIRDPSAAIAPPVLVFFGLRDGFVCVLDSVKVKTVFQAPPGIRPAANNADERFPTQRLNARLAPSGEIRRARVNVTLKEYVNVPLVAPNSTGTSRDLSRAVNAVGPVLDRAR